MKVELFSRRFTSSAVGAPPVELNCRNVLSKNQDSYNSRVTKLLNWSREDANNHEVFMEILDQAAIKTSSAPIKDDRIWFDYNRENIMPMIGEKIYCDIGQDNQTYHQKI